MTKPNWPSFYKELADKLLEYKNNREELIGIIKEVHKNLNLHLPKFESEKDLIIDVDPFSVFGLFSKGLTDENRIKIMEELKKAMSIEAEVPVDLNGIPIVDPRSALFVNRKEKRRPNDINLLWDYYETAIKYADLPNDSIKDKLKNLMDQILEIKGIKNGKATMGLFWIRPETYLSLDSVNEEYIYHSRKLPSELVDELPSIGPIIDSDKYFNILEKIKGYLKSGESESKTFIEFSYNAWIYTRGDNNSQNPETNRYWVISAGENNEYFDDFIKNGIISLNWNKLDDFREFKSKDEIKQILQNKYNFNNPTNNTKAIWDFANEIKKGDTIYIKKGESTVIGKGTVANDYKYVPNEKFKHIIDVEWSDIGEWGIKEKFNPKTLTNLTKYDNYIEAIEDALKKDTKRYWFYSPGEGAKHWEEFLELGIMSVGWEEMGDFRQYETIEEINERLKDIYGSENPVNDRKAIWEFANVIKPGDIVYAKQGRRKLIGRGEVISNYKYSPDDEFKNYIDVNWTDVGEWELDRFNITKVLTDITEYDNQITMYDNLIIGKNLSYYTPEDFLSEVFMDKERYKTLVSLLKEKKNIILQGAPGVGKTFIAKRLAYSIMGKKDVSKVKTVQFHQSYSYEDFVMGYRPVKDGFELKTGVFYDFCTVARSDPESDYFFISR